VSGATLDGLTIDGQNGSFTYSGTISNAGAGRAVNILNKTGGTVTLSGDVNPAAAGRGILVQGNSTGTNTITFSGASKRISTGTSPGVNVATNTGATISFTNGGLDITTTTATGFNATGGGTVTVTAGANPNTITSGAGTALNVVSTTIGVSGLTFRSISANGGTTGIVLNATGAGGLTVTGTGTTDGSGGTIQNITSNGASFTSANNVSLSNMTFTNAGSTDGGGAGVCDGNTNAGCHAAINLSTVTHVSLTNVDISGGAEQGINGQNVTHLTLANSTIQNVGNAVNEHGIYIRGLFGTVAGGTVNSITNTTVTNAGNHNVFILTSTATNAFPGQADRLELTNSTFSNPGSAVPSDGVTVAVRGTANFQTVVTGSTFSRVTSACCDGIQVDAGDTSHSDVTITGSTITGPWGQSAINLSGANTSVTTFNISNNPTITGGLGQGINVASNNDSTLNGTIANNPNITTAQANNAGQGIWVLVDSGGQTIVDINTNTITNFSNGIVAGARNTPQGTADITIRNSTVTNGGNFASYGVWVFSGNGSAGETNRTCVNLSNNDVSISPLGIVEYALEQYAGTTFQLQGFVGSGTSATDVTNYVDARDIGATSVDPDGLSGFLSVTAATCATP
jgi:hypothetical protein